MYFSNIPYLSEALQKYVIDTCAVLEHWLHSCQLPIQYSIEFSSSFSWADAVFLKRCQTNVNKLLLRHG
jgi:hypothetical protein